MLASGPYYSVITKLRRPHQYHTPSSPPNHSVPIHQRNVSVSAPYRVSISILQCRHQLHRHHQRLQCQRHQLTVSASVPYSVIIVILQCQGPNLQCQRHQLTVSIIRLQYHRQHLIVSSSSIYSVTIINLQPKHRHLPLST